MLTAVELPDDFAERIYRLRNPERLILEMVRELEFAERRDRLHERFDAAQAAWAALEPDLRRRYLDAMGRRTYQFLQPYEPDPEVEAEADRILAQAQAQAPAVAGQAGRPGSDWIRAEQAEQLRQRQEEHAAMLDRLAAAGLPYLPELVYPTDDDVWSL